ncbi:hypothetical protein [Clostridium sp. DJ247]|uniref:hypothetical protein n=1 Tax=Clostridium sp. DJ247 TaxID=2726188 RepID=UPI001629A7CE|nr:hypothetical protein [Clostridium sp. DJ247]MBC2581019.1 hypothetical protein [Clostridium sp. DJ247]
MNENILMLLSLDEISSTVKGLRLALNYINDKEIKIDEKFKKDIDDMLKKLRYVESEYIKKAD